MAEVSLQDALGLTINEWFGGSAIDVHSTLDATLGIIASIAVKAGCNTDERIAILADHMKTNLAAQLNRERTLRGLAKDGPELLEPEMLKKVTVAAKQALDTGASVRVEGANGPKSPKSKA